MYSHNLLTREDDGEEDELSVYPKRRKTMDLYMNEREGKPNADCQNRSPMPSTSAEPSSSPWGQARPTGACQADGGKRGWWGQARLVGAGEANRGRKLPGQIHSQHSPFGPRFSKRNETKQKNQTKV